MISNDNFLTNNGNFVGIYKSPTTVNGTQRLRTSGGGIYNMNNIYMAVRRGLGFINTSGLTGYIDLNNSNCWTSYDYSIQDLVNNYTIPRTNIAYNLASGTPSLQYTGNNQYITHDSSYRISGTGAFSIELWYRPENGGASQPLFFSGSSSVAGYAAVRLTVGTSFGFVGYNGTTNYSITVAPGSASVYHHYVVTRDGSGNVTVYRDVTTTNTGTANYSINPSAANTEYTGYDANVPNTNFMVGYLPVYRVYNRALTAAEILGNYNMERQRFGV